MGEIKTLADKVWREGSQPRHEFIRLVTDKIDELVGDGTLEAARSTGQELEGAVDFAEIADPGGPAAGYIRLFAANESGFGVLETENSAGRVFRINEDTFRIVRNTTGVTLNRGEIVYFSGSTGNKPNVALAKADASATMPAVAMVDVPIDDNAFGIVIVVGRVDDLDTSAFSEGDTLYVSAATAGELTATRPTHPDFAQVIGTVEVSHASNGAVLVNVAPSESGRESGTIENEFAIGDGLAGAKDIAFADDAGRALLRWSSGQLSIEGNDIFDTGDIATQSEAEAGTDNTTVMTPLRAENHLDIHRAESSAHTADNVDYTPTRPSATATDVETALHIDLYSPLHYAGDLATSESATQTTALNAMTSAARGTSDADTKSYEGLMSLNGYRWRVDTSVNMTVFRNRHGAGLRDGWLLGHTTGAIVLDLTGSDDLYLSNIGIYGDETDTPSAGIVGQRYDSGGGTVPGTAGLTMTKVSVRGEYTETGIGIYGVELMSWDDVVSDNSVRDTSSYAVILSGYVDAARTTVPVPGSSFQTNVDGSRSFMRGRIRQLTARRLNQPGTSITGITQANPAVVTYTGTDLTNSDSIVIEGVSGMTEINQGIYTVANIDTGAKTFELSGTDSSAFTAYTSGGTVFYQTGPALYISRSSYMEVDGYTIPYGADATVLERNDNFGDEGLKLHLHTEGAGIQSLVHFKCNNATYNIDNFEFVENATQAHAAWLKVTAGGASGKLVLNRPKIVIDRIHTAPDTGVLLFDNPGKVELYNADITLPSRSYMNPYDTFTVRPTGTFHYLDTGETDRIVDQNGYRIIEHSDGAGSGPHLTLVRKSDSPAVADVVGQIEFAAENDAGDEVTYARFRTALIDVTDGNEEASVRMDVLSAGAFTEVWRADKSGLKIAGNNLAIDLERHFQLRSYTVATLPSAASAGQWIYVSDETGGAIPAFSDGTNWRRVTDRAIVA